MDKNKWKCSYCGTISCITATICTKCYNNNKNWRSTIKVKNKKKSKLVVRQPEKRIIVQL